MIKKTSNNLTLSNPFEFNSHTPELRAQRQLAHEACRTYQRSPSKGHLKKIKALFKRCGDSVFIEAGFHCDYGNKISIGNRSYLNINCTLLDGGNIIIGDDVLIAPNVQIITINHDLSPDKRLKKRNFAQDVHVEDNVWIGAGSIILPGCHIKAGSVIGAGSVVCHNVDSKVLVAGNPARYIKDLK